MGDTARLLATYSGCSFIMKLLAALVVAMLVGVVLSETALPDVDAPSAESQFLEEDVEDIHQDDVSQSEAVVAEEKAQVQEEMKSLIDSGSSMMKKWNAKAHKDSAEAQPVAEDLEEVDEPVEAADLDPRSAHQSQDKVEDDYAAIFHHSHSKKPAAKKIHYRPEGRDEADMGEVETSGKSASKFIKKVEEEEPSPKAPYRNKSKRVQAQKAELEEEAEALKKQNMVMLRESKAAKQKRRKQRTAEGLREAAKLLGKKVTGRYLNKPEDKEAQKWLGHTAFVRTMPKSWTKRPKKLSERQQKKKMHKNINWVKKALNMPPDETDMEAASGHKPDHQAEKWMGMIPSHNAKSPADHHKKKLVQVMDEEEVQDPRGHHHQQPPSPQIFIGQEQMQRSNSGTMRPPALRMMTEEEREKEEIMAEQARAKKHAKKEAREIKDSREHRNLERNPVMRNAKPLPLPHVKPSLPKVHLPNAEEEAAMDSAARKAIRAQSRYRRKVKRHADAKRRAVLAQKQPVKKHKKLTADEYKRQLHNRVVNNPVFKHARLYGLLKTKKTKKHKNADAGAFDSEHKGVLSLAGLNTARKNGYKHVSLDFGLDNN